MITEKQLIKEFNKLDFDAVFNSQNKITENEFQTGFENIKQIDYFDSKHQQVIFVTYEGYGYDEDENTPEEILFAELNDDVQDIVQEYLFNQLAKRV